jgi:PAS domain S-box-containing protein
LIFPLALFVAGGILAFEEIAKESENSNATAERSASLLVGALRFGLETDKGHDLSRSKGPQEFADDMFRDDGYDITIVDTNCRILGSSKGGETGKTYSCSGQNQIRMTLRDGVPRVFNGSMVEGSGNGKLIAVPLTTDGGKMVGVLLMDCSAIYAAAEESILRTNTAITIAVFIGIICSILFGSFLSSRITAQIRSLERGAREIALGNLDFRIVCDGNIELGVLRDAFNSMAMDLKTSRHRLEDQLRETQKSETRFRLATLATHDMIWEINGITLEATYSGDMWLRLGYPEEEIVPTFQFWKEHIHPDDVGRLMANYESSFVNRKESWSDEYRIRRRDGSYLTVLARVYAVYDGDGRLQRLIGAGTDVTDRKNAEQALARSEISFRLLFANNPQPMWVYDLDTYAFLEVNDAAVEKYGYSREEFLGMTLADIRPPEDVPRLLENLARKRTALSRSEEWRHMKKGGEVFFVNIQSHELEFMGRRAVLVIAQDITSRKEAERKLRESEIRFRSLIERSSDVTSIIDRTGKILYMSPSFSRMGYSPENVRGNTALELVHPEDAARLLDTIKLALQEPEVAHMVQLRFRDKDGAWHDSESIIFNQLNVPEVRGLVVNSRDITEKRKLESQFLRAQRMESVGILAGGIAHDLNNILAPIMLSVDMLREEHPTLKSRAMINTIETSVKRGADLVRQVLSFSRGTGGEQTIIQLRHLVSETEKILRETFPKSVDIITDIPKNLWTVKGDATQIHQVMMNLCVNARDALPKGGRIEITAENVALDEKFVSPHPKAKTGPHVILSFADTGVGIPASDLDKIFDPFFTTKETGKGTGLGLSTVSTIVKNHGGFVDVESEVGKGTTFKIYLPAQTAPEIIREPNAAKESCTGNGELILIIDDETALRDFVKVTLETYGYRTIEASDGAEAVEVFARSKKKIDVVITDIMMPYMDGIAAIAVLRRLDPEIKVVAVSGLTEVEDKPGLKEVDAFLNKPFSAGLLLKTLSDVVKRRSSVRSPLV